MADKCFGIYLIKDTNEKFITDLSNFNFFTRSKIKELMYGSVKEIILRSDKLTNNIIDIELKFDQIFYLVGVKTSKASCLIFTVESNPHKHLQILAQYLLIHEMADTIQANFEHIKSETKIKQIQTELEEVKYIMINNIETILERGEKMEDLLIKTQYLSDASKQFVIETKKLNRCCIIL